MELNVRIEKALPALVPGAISFETGARRADLDAPDVFAYEHHGEEFRPSDRGALPCFFEDLLLGRPLPLTFATHSIQDIDTLVAIAVFLHRDLATHPATPELVYTADFVHRLGLPALAHIAEDKARFLSALRGYFPEKGLSQRELSERVVTAVGWVREYLQEGRIPVLGPVPQSDIRVLDHGTSGFVVAETPGNLLDGWVELFRLGFLRGVLFGHRAGDRKAVLVARKSHFVALDLPAAARALNQLEITMGETPEWTVSRDGLWLEHQAGTLLLLSQVLAVLVRV
jgi:hypothetical protein